MTAALIAAAALSLAPAQESGGALVLTRQDFAELVQGVDRRIAEGALLPPTDELSGLARTNDAFDSLSREFLGGRLGAAMQSLDTLCGEVGVPRDPAGAVRLDVRQDGRWVRSAAVSIDEVTLASPVRFRLRSVLPWPEAAGTSPSVAFVRGAGGPTWPALDVPARFDELGRLVPLEFEVEPSCVAFPGAWQPFVWMNGRAAGAGSLELAAAPGAAAAAHRADWLRRIGAAEGADERCKRALASRAELRWEAPSQERSAEFLLDPNAHRASIDAHVEAIERGEDPLRLRTADHWRTFAHGRRDLAARVFLPGVAPKESIPLVIAFHGAGGDESFFFELAGDGHVKALASRHGCLVVTPFTPDFLWSAKAFDSLLAGIAADYPIDPERVFLFGHSMGTGATTRICKDRPDRVAGACCVAGFSPVPEGAPPMLVVQGERDRIVPARAVRLAAEASSEADVTYVELPDQGHTLLLPDAFDLAFSRWFE